MPKKPLQQNLMGDLSQVAINDFVSGSGIEPDIPTAKLDVDQVNKWLEIVKQFGSEASPHSSLRGLVHDEVVFEIPVPKKREPVTAERTFTALMKKPELAYGVFLHLVGSVLLGPWVTEGPTPFRGDYQDQLEGNGWPPKLNTWKRHTPGPRRSVTVDLFERGYHAHRFHSAIDEHDGIPRGLFAGPDVGDAHALMMIDEMLEAAGYRLV